MMAMVAPSTSAPDREQHCLEYERACWIDSIQSEEDIKYFGLVLEEAAQLSSFQSELYLIRAWSKTGLPKPAPTRLPMSPILVAALTHCRASSDSSRFSFITAQVASKCLLFHYNPLPLAALVVYFCDEGMDESLSTPTTSGSAPSKALTHYSRSLIKFDPEQEMERKKLLCDLVSTYFSVRSYQQSLLDLLERKSRRSSNNDILKSLPAEHTDAALRQLRHIFVSTNDDDIRRNCFEMICHLLPLVVHKVILLCVDNLLFGWSYFSHYFSIYYPQHEAMDELLECIYSRLEAQVEIDIKYLDLAVLTGGGASLPPCLKIRLQEYVVAIGRETMTNKTKRIELLFLVALKSSLQLPVLQQLTRKCLGLCSTLINDSILSQVVTTISTSLLQECSLRLVNSNSVQCDTSEAKDILETWMSLSGARISNTSARKAAHELIQALESRMCQILDGDQGLLVRAKLCSACHEKNPAEIVNSLFQSKITLSTSGTKRDCLMSRWLDYDFSHFASSFFTKIVSMNDQFRDLWDEGLLDESMQVVVSSPDFAASKDKISNVIEIILDRALMLCTTIVSTICRPRTLWWALLFLFLISSLRTGPVWPDMLLFREHPRIMLQLTAFLPC